MKEFIITCGFIYLLNMGGYFFDIAIIEIIDCFQPRVIIRGVEFVNPVWWYKNYRVNYFGAVMAALVCTLFCPIAAVAYWFYKLCTVGRNKNE